MNWFVMLKEERGEGWGREIDGEGKRHRERRGEVGTEGEEREYSTGAIVGP